MSESTPPPALRGLRVLDLSETTGGAYCAKLLGDYGADVVLAEPPGGNLLRRRPPLLGDGTSSAAFAYYHGGKRSVTLESVADSGSRSSLRSLIEETDVLVLTLTPAESEARGLDFGTLRTVNPSLVLVSVTDFGQTGPYRNYPGGEGVVEALSGQMFATGRPDRPPLAAGVEICGATAGLHAYFGTLCALRLRARDGQARHVDVSLLEAGLENMELRAYPNWRADKDPSRLELAHAAVIPWGVYSCRNGFATLHAAPFHRWRAFADLLRGGRIFEKIYAAGIARAERSADVGSGSVGGGPARKLKALFLKQLDREVRYWAARRTREEILRAGSEKQLAFGVLREIEEIPELPQHRARNFFTRIDHPGIGPVEQPRWLFPSASAHCGPAPRLGQHDDIPWCHPRSEPSTGGGIGIHRTHTLPLAGVRVIDLTLVEAAPHGTRVLADYGAEVIKIEYPGRLDIFRGTSLRERAYDRQPLWAQLNRNKRSVTLDLKTDAGRAAFFELLSRTDIVVCNYRCGVLESLGLDHASLRRHKADIITVTLSGFGAGGPDSHRPAYGAVIEAMSGVQNLTGHRDARPERIREIDVLNGIAGAVAAITALHRREVTGQGEHIDLSQMEATTHALMGETLLALSAGHQPPSRSQSWSGDSPVGCFPCAGESDQWIFLHVSDEIHWRALVEIIGRRDWVEDGRFADSSGRRVHEVEINDAISSWSRTLTPDEAMHDLQTAGVPAGAVRSLGGILIDPHLTARGWFVITEEDRFMGFPFRISDCILPTPRPGPTLGEGNATYQAEVRSPVARSAFAFDPDTLRSAFHLDSRRPSRPS